MYNRHGSIYGACHAVLWTDSEHGVAPVGQLTLHHAPQVVHTQFSNKRLWTGRPRRVTPSLRDARRHVTHVYSATSTTCDTGERSRLGISCSRLTGWWTVLAAGIIESHTIAQSLWGLGDVTLQRLRAQKQVYMRAGHDTYTHNQARALIHSISFHHFISFHFISFHFISFHSIPFHSIPFHSSASLTHARHGTCTRSEARVTAHTVVAVSL